MKRIYLLLFVFSTLIYSQTQYRFNINNINLPLDNKGILADVNIPDPDPNISGRGGKFGGQIFLYGSGFFLAGYANDTLWANGVASSSLIEDYLPGIVGNEPSDPKNIIYVVKESDPDFGPSWQSWIDAVSLGADFYDGNNDNVYNPVDLDGNNKWDTYEDKPALIGNRMAWCVYNDKKPARNRRFNDVNPLGIEIRQAIVGFATLQNPLSNTLFIRYRLINTGTEVNKLDSVYFALYADADIGDGSDDLVGCDTLLNSGFIYNDGPDDLYGSQPPAFYMKYLQGPVAYAPGETFIDNNSNGIYESGIDTPLDTAYNRRGALLGVEIYPGAKNLQLTSSRMIIGGDDLNNDPSNAIALRHYLSGLLKNGSIVDPCNFWYGNIFGGVNCAFVKPHLMFSGDPVSNVGWIQTVDADIRNLVTTGRFNLEVNKPIDIWAAYIIDKGTDALNAITVTRNHANNVQTFFDTSFIGNPNNVGGNYPQVKDYKLFQNYPNPFNPTTKIKFQIPQSTSPLLGGGKVYPPQVGGGLVTLKVYDVLGNEVATLVNEYREAGTYEVEFDASALTSGVYFYKLNTGAFTETKKMLMVK